MSGDLNPSRKKSDILIAEINRNPSQKTLWISLFENLLEEHRHRDAIDLISLRQKNFGDALSYSYDVLVRLAVNERADILEPFISALGQGHLIYPVTLFVRGVLAASREKPAEAAGLFKASVNAVSAIVAVAQHDSEFTGASFHHMLNQARQVEAPEFLLSLGDDDVVPAVAFDDRTLPSGKFVIAAACDGRYFVNFAPLLAASVAQTEGDRAILHINVVDVDPAAEACIKELEEAYPNLRVSQQAGQIVGRASAYYACNRFLLAPALLDRYQRPMVIVDIDVTLKQDLANLLPFMEDLDIALFEWANPIPSMRCFCMLAASSNTSTARQFLRVLGRYLLQKLGQGALWMTDQASLWSVSRSIGITLHGPRYGNLTALTGASYEDFVLSNEQQVNKHQLRKSNDLAFDPSLDPTAA
jgi:hypothetical protein